MITVVIILQSLDTNVKQMFLRYKTYLIQHAFVSLQVAEVEKIITCEWVDYPRGLAAVGTCSGIKWTG